MEQTIQAVKSLSLDELDRISFRAGSSPFDVTVDNLILAPIPQTALEYVRPNISLDGECELCEATPTLADGDWSASISAHVPGSVHTALVSAGQLPDPTIGDNQKIAREVSYKSWIYRKLFTLDNPIEGRYRLEFEGICNQCTIILNDQILGQHEGMFCGPEYDVSGMLKQKNILLVKLEPIPFISSQHPYPENNTSWNQTVVINNVYGWHYSNMPSLGIWRSVKLVHVPYVEIKHAFISTKSLEPATMQLQVELNGPEKGWRGLISIQVVPKNFTGISWGISCSILSESSDLSWTSEWVIPDAHIWWPVDLGDPDLYQITELALFKDQDRFPYPIYPGYASIFRIEAVGSYVTDIGVGDLVFGLFPHQSYVKARRKDVLLLDKSMNLELVIFARMAGVSMSTLLTTKAHPPQRVMVNGLGIVGNLAAQIFQSCGYRVIACGESEERRELARSINLTDVFDQCPLDQPGQAGEISLVLECRGNEIDVLNGCKMVCMGGEVVLVGVPWAQKTNLPAFNLIDAIFHRYVTLRSGWEWEFPFCAEYPGQCNLLDQMQAAITWLHNKRLWSTIFTEFAGQRIFKMSIKAY